MINRLRMRLIFVSMLSLLIVLAVILGLSIQFPAVPQAPRVRSLSLFQLLVEVT